MGSFYRRTSYTRPFKAGTWGVLSYVTRLFKAGTWGVFIEGLVILVHLKLEHGEFYRMLLVYLKLEHGEFYHRTSHTRPFKAGTWGVLS